MGGFLSFKLDNSNFYDQKEYQDKVVFPYQSFLTDELINIKSTEFDLIYEYYLIKHIPLETELVDLTKSWKIDLENNFKITSNNRFIFAFSREKYHAKSLNDDLEKIIQRIKNTDLEGIQITLLLLEENFSSSALKIKIEQKQKLYDDLLKVEIV